MAVAAVELAQVGIARRSLFGGDIVAQGRLVRDKDLFGRRHQLVGHDLEGRAGDVAQPLDLVGLGLVGGEGSFGVGVGHHARYQVVPGSLALVVGGGIRRAEVGDVVLGIQPKGIGVVLDHQRLLGGDLPALEGGHEGLE